MPPAAVANPAVPERFHGVRSGRWNGEDEIDPEEFPELAAILEDEDEDIFDQCFLEELREILADAHEDGVGEEEACLPLDFLPYVLNEGEEKPSPYISEIPVWEMEVRAEEVFPGQEETTLATRTEEPAEAEIPEIDWDSRRMDFEALLSSGSIWEQAEGEDFMNDEGDPAAEPLEYHPQSDDKIIEAIRCGEPEPKVPGTSIFAPLFQRTDRDGKLILLKEIRKIGGEKEYAFLNKLEETDPVVLAEARSTAKLLSGRRHWGEGPEQRTLETIEEITSQPPGGLSEFSFEPDFGDSPTDDTASTEQEAHPGKGGTIRHILDRWRQLIKRN